MAKKINKNIEKMYQYFKLTDDWYAEALLARLENEIKKQLNKNEKTTKKN